MKELTAKHKQAFTGFALEEATALLNQHIIRKQDIEKSPLPENIGFVAGVLTLNDEVEVLVKFIDEAVQFTKYEFQSQLVQLHE